jgi:c-di-GMP-binding flagellar brake protein YcgR
MNQPDRKKPLMSRRIRMPGSHVVVLLDERRGTLLNLSLTGALVSMEEPPPVESDHALALQTGDETLKVTAHVVRVTRDEENQRSRSAFTVAVTFPDRSPETQRAIQRFYGHLARQG